MRIIFISTFLLALTSCTLPFGKQTSVSSEVSTPAPVVTTSDAPVVEKVAAANNLVTLNYTLRDAADGKILETTLASVAEQNGTFDPAGRYQPFQVMLGQNSVIPGFENGLLGMKKGERKTIRVTPDQGYGTSPKIQEVPKYQIAPVFTMTQPRNLVGDTITQTVEKSTLADEMKNAIIGQTLTGANGATAVVTAVTDTTMTFEIQNIDNPFYKKELSVGLVAENETASFKIMSLSDTGVTMEVTNKQSPFYNKPFAVGESFTLPQGGKINIVAIGDETVTIGEEHAMMGKTLEFDVEIIDIQ